MGWGETHFVRSDIKSQTHLGGRYSIKHFWRGKYVLPHCPSHMLVVAEIWFYNLSVGHLTNLWWPLWDDILVCMLPSKLRHISFKMLKVPKLQGLKKKSTTLQYYLTSKLFIFVALNLKSIQQTWIILKLVQTAILIQYIFNINMW